MKKTVLFLFFGLILSFFSLRAQPPGNALSFDGVDDYVNISGFEDWKLRAANYSLEAWILPEMTTDQLIFYHGVCGWECPSWSLSIGPENTCNTPYGASGRITFQSGTAGSEVIQSHPVFAGHWVHVAVTFDGANIRLYVNGALQGTTSWTSSPYDNNNGFIGIDPGYGCGFTRYPYKGKMDEVRVWSTSRSEVDIRANMNDTIAANIAGLEVYYRFDHPAGTTTVTDLAGGGNNGTLTDMDPATCWIESYAMVVPATTITNVGFNEFTVSWTAPEVGVTEGYYLEISTDADFQSKLTGYDPYKDMGTATTETVTGLNSGSFYYYRVRAHKASVGDVGGFYYTEKTPVYTKTTPPGKALEFYNPDHKVMVDMNINPTEIPVMSASLWVMRTGTSTGIQSIISNDNGGFDRGIQVYNGMYRIFAGRSIATYIPSELNVWEHIAVYWSASEIKMFKNGKQVFTTTGETVTVGATNFSIGNKPNGTLPFPGLIDELCIWNTMPTVSGIQASMYHPINPASAGLLAYYNFDDGFGTILTDSINSLHNGVLTNMDNFSWVESYAMICPPVEAAYDIDYTEFTFDWTTPVEGVVEGYVVEVATDSLFVNKVSGYDPYDAGMATSITVTGLLSSTTYYYRTRAYKSSVGFVGGSHFTAPKAVSTLIIPANAVDFDGVNDYIAGNPFTTQMDNITMEAWVKWDGVEAGMNEIIMYNGNPSTTGYGLFINSTDNYELSLLCGGVLLEPSDYKLPAGVWSHVAIVKNTGVWSLHANGVAYSFTSSPGSNPILGTDKGLIGGNVSGTENFNGQIDEVRIWNIALDPCDISGYAHSEYVGSETDLAAYYNFNQGEAGGDNNGEITLEDLTSGGNDLTLTNFALIGATSNWVASGVQYTATAIYDGGLPPVPDVASLTELTAECSVDAPTAPTATDACEGAITGTTTTVFPITTQGASVITWTFDDGFGNITTQVQNVVIEDITDPIAVCQDVILSLDENGNAGFTTQTIYFTGTIGNKIWLNNGITTEELYDTATADAAGPVGIDYCSENGNLYWGGGNQHEVYSAPADGSGTPTVLLNSQIGGEHHSLDIDYPNNRYFFSAGYDGVYVANLDGTGMPTLLNSNAQYAIGIKYNSIDNNLYFTEVNNGNISSMSDDGSNYTVLYDYSENVNGPRDLVIDPANSKLYWVNRGTQSIMSGNMDGSGSPVELYTGQAGIFGLYYLQSTQTLYWSTFTSGSISSWDVILKAPADGSGTPTVVLEGNYGSIRGLCVMSQEINNGSSDNCELASISYDVQAFDCNDIGSNLVTMTVTDVSGNSSSCTSTVTVIDSSSPVPNVATLPFAIGSCSVTVANVPTATDNCSGPIIGTTTDPLTYNIVGTYFITWSYEDNEGNISTQVQNVFVNDQIAPVPNIATLADVTGECSVTVTGIPTAADACEGTIDGTTTDDLYYDVEGIYHILWSFEDLNGNISYSIQNVIVDDVTPPVADALSLPDLTDGCSAVMPTAPTATDNCAGTITGTTTTVFPVVGTSVIVWSFDDGNGNISTQTQNVTITDLTPPVADAVSLPDLTDPCFIIPAIPTATDNCAGTILATTTTFLPVVATTVVVWTFVDGNGNSITQTQNITITDLTPPVANVTTLTDLTDECSVNPSIPTATDNCSGVIHATTTTTLPVTAQGATVITWTFEDNNGNTITQTQNVSIDDVSVPVADITNLPDITVNCSSTPVAPTATDNCSGTITGVSSETFPITDLGTTVVTWTFDDGNGQVVTQDQNVIVLYEHYTETASATICSGSTYTFGTQTLSTPGSFVETFASVNGCDSVVTLTLTLNPAFDINLGPNDTLCQQGETVILDAGIANMTYLWSDNSTSQTLLVNGSMYSVGGNYFSVTVTDGVCTAADTILIRIEVCTDLNAIADEFGVSLYPNPSEGMVYVSSDHLTDYNCIIVRDAIGRVILKKNVENQLEKMDLSTLSKGLYLIEVQGSENSTFHKIRLE